MANRKHDVSVAVDHMIEVLRIAGTGLVSHNREGGLALNGAAVALRRKHSDLVDQIMEKLEA